MCPDETGSAWMDAAALSKAEEDFTSPRFAAFISSSPFRFVHFYVLKTIVWFGQ